jgi:hypothetical protein
MNFANSLVHFLYPRQSNDHKAKLLHSHSLLLLAGVLVVFQVVLRSFPLVSIGVLGYAANISPSEIINLANQKRQEIGLFSLEHNPLLEAAAREKGEHMLENDYWAHVSPDGTEPWVFFVEAGYKYRYAGENLARDFSNPNSAIDAWMASPSHKDNLLSDKYKEIGVAVVEGDLNGVDSTIIVQLFGTQLADDLSQVPLAEAKTNADQVLVSGLEPTTVPVSDQAALPPSSSEGEKIAVTSEPVKNKISKLNWLTSPFSTTRSVSLAVVVFLLVVMVVDGFVVSRKRIPRIGGRVFAHLAFLGMVLAIVFIARAGEIL